MDYTTLITSEHQDKPKFKALVAAVAGAFGDTRTVFSRIVSDYDLDVAVGDQLDAIGLWVGLARYISIPMAVYFSFDTAGLGFDQGNWKGPFDPDTGLTRLDDSTYLTMIRAKIGANNWDGTAGTMLAIFQRAFVGTGTLPFVTDNQDMTMTIGLSGVSPPALLKSLLTNGYLPLKPAGVKVNYLQTSVSGTPLFGFDINNQYIGGFDTGAFAITL